MDIHLLTNDATVSKGDISETVFRNTFQNFSFGKKRPFFTYFQNISRGTSFQKIAKVTSHCIVVFKPWAGGSPARIYT